MTTYKDIHGFQIEVRSDNPSNPVNGQVWYNTTNSKLKGNAQTTAAAWSSGGTLNAVRFESAASGIQTAALTYGGRNPSPAASGKLAITESYNGTSWTEVGDLNAAKEALSGTAADNTSAIVFGGSLNPGLTVNTETWNGTAWTEVNNLNTARDSLAGAGVTAAALAFGGATPSATVNTELWNGTSWTEVANLATARKQIAGCGTNTAALSIGGAPITATTEEWNAAGADDIRDFDVS